MLCVCVDCSAFIYAFKFIDVSSLHVMHISLYLVPVPLSLLFFFLKLGKGHVMSLHLLSQGLVVGLLGMHVRMDFLQGQNFHVLTADQMFLLHFLGFMVFQPGCEPSVEKDNMGSVEVMHPRENQDERKTRHEWRTCSARDAILSSLCHMCS